MRHLFQIILFFHGLFGGVLFAQTAESWRDSAVLLSNQGRTDEAKNIIKKSINLALQSADTLQLINSRNTEASIHFLIGEYDSAYFSYRNALSYASPANYFYFFNFLTQIAQVYEKLTEAHGELFLEIRKDLNKSADWAMRCPEIVVQDRKEYVFVPMGSSDGFLTQVLFIYTTRTSDNNYADYQYLGEAHYHSEISGGTWYEIEWHNKPDHDFSGPGDLLMKTIRAPDLDGDLLATAFLKGCTFKNNSSELPLSHAMILSRDYDLYKPILMEYYRGMIQEVYELYSADSAFSMLWEVSESGMYKDQAVWSVLKNPGIEDIEHFLRFVLAHANRYAGRDFKFNETYATWLLNSAPMEKEQLTDLLLSIPRSMRTSMFIRYDYQITGEQCTDFWKKNVEIYRKGFEVDKAESLQLLLMDYLEYSKDLQSYVQELQVLGALYVDDQRPQHAYDCYKKCMELLDSAGLESLEDSIRLSIEALAIRNVDVMLQVGHSLSFYFDLHPNGNIIYTGGRDGIFNSWDVKAGMLISSEKIFDFSIISVEVSSDGAYVIVADNFGEIKLISTKTLETVYTYLDESYKVSNASIDRDNRLIAFGSGNDLKLIDWQKDIYVPCASLHKGEIKFVYFGRTSGKLYSVGEDRIFYEWDPWFGNWTKKYELEAPAERFVLSRDETYMAALLNNGSLELWDVTNAIDMKTLVGFPGIDFDIKRQTIPCFTPDNRYLIYASGYGKVMVHRLSDGKERDFYVGGMEYTFITQTSVNLQGHTLVISTDLSHQPLMFWDLSSFEFEESPEIKIKILVPSASRPIQVQFNESGNELYVGSFSIQSHIGSINMQNGSTSDLENKLEIKGQGAFTVQNGNMIWLSFEGGHTYYNEQQAEGGTLYEREIHYIDYLQYAVDAESRILFYLQDDSLVSYDVEDGLILAREALPNDLLPVYRKDQRFSGTQLEYNPYDHYLYFINGDHKLYKLDPWSLRRESKRSGGRKNTLNQFCFLDGGRRMVLAGYKRIEVIDLVRRKVIYSYVLNNKKYEGYTAMQANEDGSVIYLGSYANELVVLDMITGTITNSGLKFGWFIASIALDKMHQVLAVAGEDNHIKIVDARSLDLLFEVFPQFNGEFVFMDKEQHYWAPKTALEGIAFVSGNKVYPVQQFDQFYNRPDLVLACFPNADESYLQAVSISTQRRIGLKTETAKLEKVILPTIRIVNQEEMKKVTMDSSIEVVLELTDFVHGIKELRIFLNGVLIEAVANTDSLKGTVKMSQRVMLVKGANKLSFVTINNAGEQSLPELLEIRCDLESKVELYLAVMSVSHFRDSSFNLKYATKDGRDLIGLFAADTLVYSKIHVLELYDTAVNLENFSLVRRHLSKAGLHDKVVLYLSGHGLLDDDYNFYFAGYDCDFEHPERNGIPYDSIVSVFASTASIQRLLFMDACHSGEVDRGELITLSDSALAGAKSGVKRYSYRGTVTSDMDTSGLSLFNTFELMKEMFSEGSGDGIQVISAAAGDSYALESAQWSNGVFTYALLEGISTMKADLNSDGIIKVSELRDYVIQRVFELTDGAQKPTVRQENIEFDFRIW